MAEGSRGNWSELAAAALAAPGRRTGSARQAVVELLDGEDCCLTTQEMVDRLHRRGEQVGVASVYRAIERLRDAGLVDRIEVGEGVARYEAVVPGGEHHHHVVCEVCGRITPFSDPSLERAIGGLADRLEHRVSAHDVLIRGACRRCARGATKAPGAKG